MINYNLISNDFEFDFNLNDVIEKVLNAVSDLKLIDDEHVISYVLLNKEQIHEMNRNYRNIDRPTDVISFALMDGEEDIPYELGDIYICYEKIFEQAKDYGHTPLREAAFLVTHGTLHLLGYDHIDYSDEQEMFKLQDKILEIAKISR